MAFIPIGIHRTYARVPGGSGFSFTVSVDEAPAVDSYILLDVSDSSVITSDLGPMPIQVLIPADHTEGSGWLNTNNVDDDTFVFVAVGLVGTDLSQSENICAAITQVVVSS